MESIPFFTFSFYMKFYNKIYYKILHILQISVACVVAFFLSFISFAQYRLFAALFSSCFFSLHLFFFLSLSLFFFVLSSLEKEKWNHMQMIMMAYFKFDSIPIQNEEDVSAVSWVLVCLCAMKNVQHSFESRGTSNSLTQRFLSL